MRSLGGYRSILPAAIAMSMLILAACTPAGAPPPAPAEPAPAAPAPAAPAPAAPAPAEPAPAEPTPAEPTPDDWDAIVEAAKQEGVVVCACPPRPDYSALLKEAFEAANPGIRLETSPATLPDIWARVEHEQQAGQYLWDVYMFGPTLEMFALKDQGAFEPFRDYMVGPSFSDPSVWLGGFDQYFFLDNEQMFVSAFWLNVTSDSTINRDLLPDAQVSTFEELLNPEYRGLIVMQDPRGGGKGISWLTGAYQYKGPEGVEAFLVGQEPMLVRGNVEEAEQLVRGGRAITANSVSEDTLVQFREAGVPLNLENFNLEDMPSASNGGQAPAVFRNPPNPNATKVFLNWVFGPEAQQLLANELRQNSLRVDVAPGNELTLPSPDVEWFHTQLEESMAVVTREAQALARELRP